jgi:hypothetical protein
MNLMDKVPDEFVLVPNNVYPAIAAPLERISAGRYAAIFRITSSSIGIHTGRRIEALMGSDAQPLTQCVGACLGASHRKALVVDRNRRRAWRADLAAAVDFVMAHAA